MKEINLTQATIILNQIVNHKSNQSSQTHGKANTRFWDTADTNRGASLLLTYRTRGCPWETVLRKATGAGRPETEPCTRGRGGPPQCTQMHSEAECWGAGAVRSLSRSLLLPLSLLPSATRAHPSLCAMRSDWLGKASTALQVKNTAASSFLLHNALRFAVTQSHLLSLFNYSRKRQPVHKKAS